MASPASFAGHPFHPMLVVFPIGLWIFSFVSDLIWWFGWGGDIWTAVSFRNMAAGIAGALLAAIPGFIDFLTLSGRPLRTAAFHLSLNLALVILFGVNLGFRAAGFSVAPWPLLMSLVGVIGLGISGWLGGKLVYIYDIAVNPRPANE